jgi:Holliday junction resolvase RusA-like endonuclease
MPTGNTIRGLLHLCRDAEEVLSFDVMGMEPAPQGSKRPVGRDRQGRALMVESCKRVKPWRQLVADAALAVAPGRPLIASPCVLCAEFRFLRPKGHYGGSGQLRAKAPRHHTVRPDVSKLLRSTEDALTGVLLRDDSLIIAAPATKRYCLPDERPGALITLYTLP